MNRRSDAPTPRRLTSWLRKAYPPSAPARGHNYLIALCGDSGAAN